MNKEIINVNCVNKYFTLGDSKLHVLKDINLKINRGEFVSIMGESGSGKSTLLYLMGGLDTISKGSIFVNGVDINKLSDEAESRIRRNDIGFIFQNFNLIENLTVEENILLPALLDGKKKKNIKDKLEEILESVGLTDRRNHTPKELSGGEQQRTAIARALINNPQILFADEPTGNLDSKTGEDILNLIKELNHKNKITVVMITHSKEASEYGDRIIKIKDGRIE